MFTIQQIEQAHAKVKSGADFPKYIQEIKQLGVAGFETWVKDSHTEYFGANDYHITSTPMYDELAIADVADKPTFEYRLITHQRGKKNHVIFCKDCAVTGIEKWIVDFNKRNCTYYDKKANKNFGILYR